MKKLVIYIHGKGGNAKEAEHYKPLFPDCDVVGFDYLSQTPWDAQKEFPEAFDGFSSGYGTVLLVANSIGAYYSLISLSEKKIDKAFFISPIVDMEKLISDMLLWAGKSEKELCELKELQTDSGETLSWSYLTFVRAHKIKWKVKTDILYGQKDLLQSFETVSSFAERYGASLTVMEGSEHWFHTEEQMSFLDGWITNNKK